MAAVLKAWREAATLLLVSTRKNIHPVQFNPVSAIRSTNESPSLVKGDNFDVLMLKRSSKSTFMPNLYVFPGGVASDADFSKEWFDIFGQAGSDIRTNIFNFVKGNGVGSPMFNRLRDPEFSFIPSEIAFRICAIRETFEESGVLLARRVHDLDRTVSTDKPNLGIAVASDVATWRGRVEKNPSEFINMCKTLDLVPDVWSLYEWSNWLTPAHDLSSTRTRRYDTAFFICCVDDKPDVSEDQSETVHSQWGSPLNILQEFRRGKARAAPPQLFELSRLFHFDAFDDLHQYVWSHSGNRVDRIFPVRLQLADAVVFLYAGDDCYPKDFDIYGEHAALTSELTIEELNQNHNQNQNRTWFSTTDDGIIVPRRNCTITYTDKMRQPYSDFNSIMESKL